MIGQKDKHGNVFRLGGKRAEVWETPEHAFFVRHAGDFTYLDTEAEAVVLYNELEPSNHFKLPRLPDAPPPPPRKDGEPVLPTGSKLLCRYESLSRPGYFYYVIRYKDDTMRCTCFPFMHNKTCNHLDFVYSILDQGVDIKEPIVIKYRR